MPFCVISVLDAFDELECNFFSLRFLFFSAKKIQDWCRRDSNEDIVGHQNVV